MKQWMLATACLLGMLYSVAYADGATPGSAVPAGGECYDEVPYTGHFVTDTGFSAVIPKGYQGFVDSMVCHKDNEGCSCMGTDRGRFIKLGIHASIRLSTDDPALYSFTLPPAIESEISFFKGKANKGSLRVLKRMQAKLGALPAKRVVLQYTDKGTGVEMTADFTIALSKKNDPLPSYIYSVSLVTPSADYDANRKVLENILPSWQRVAPKN